MASFLEKQGYEAFTLQGEYIAWYKAGYPIELKEATEAMLVRQLCPECSEPFEAHGE